MFLRLIITLSASEKFKKTEASLKNDILVELGDNTTKI